MNAERQQKYLSQRNNYSERIPVNTQYQHQQTQYQQQRQHQPQFNTNSYMNQHQNNSPTQPTINYNQNNTDQDNYTSYQRPLPQQQSYTYQRQQYTNNNPIRYTPPQQPYTSNYQRPDRPPKYCSHCKTTISHTFEECRNKLRPGLNGIPQNHNNQEPRQQPQENNLEAMFGNMKINMIAPQTQYQAQPNYLENKNQTDQGNYKGSNQM